ncbi:hypothetical protein ABT236_32420 [Streptomyces sp. NPDC001523]|uniref:hypothetical protein n=1 Tax=Streptomyces sp. NPDC001523 TaxID=3154383 RepID=UPI003328D86A
MEEGTSAPGFAQELRELYQAAGGSAGVGYKRLVSLGTKQGLAPNDASISDWMRGRSVPSEAQAPYVLRLLIPELERLAAERDPFHQRTSSEGWRSRLRSAQERSKSRQGGRGARIRADSPARLHGHPAEVCQNILPRVFEGREAELDELAAFVKGAGGRGSDYLWWQADAWAGKSALLSWFALRYVPAGVDVVMYFIAERLGTNRREDFLRDVTEQLTSVMGRRIATARPSSLDQLGKFYEAAAKASADRGRTLLLLVDGLDEDAGAGLGGRSIAALLPRHLPPGMRVVVSGRANPPVPDDVPPDHPLRNPAIVRRLAVSPAAQVIRDMAMRDLYALLDDGDVGSQLVGLLTVARGALSGTDMADLAGVRPYDVDKQLRSIAGRGMAPEDGDRLSPGTGRAAGLPTYVLAHEELRVAAEGSLGEAEIARCEERLHMWAERYRAKGWPADTPNYLLTGYIRLIRHGADPDRLAALVLDPHRQLRLVERSGIDVALTDVAELGLTMAPEGPETPRTLAVRAGAAVSREFLLRRTRVLPRSLPRAFARLGDARRARTMALASLDATVKATALTDVARELADIGHEQAPETAREAATWAQTARRQARPFAGDGDEAEPVASRAAVALIATGQEEDGLRLLRSTRGLSTARFEAWVEAALLLLPYQPAPASDLLKELEEHAEELAREDGPSVDRAVAVQIWDMLAGASSDTAARFQDRILDHARTQWAEAPTLDNTVVLAAAASALAGTRQGEAAAMAELAGQYVESVVRNISSRRPTGNASHLELDFPLLMLVQALADLGSPMERARRILDHLPDELRTGPFDYDVTAAARAAIVRAENPTASGRDAPDEIERLADEAYRLAALGSDGEAKQCLDRALALSPEGDPGAGRVRWLPTLAGVLVRVGRHDDAEALAADLSDPDDRARALADMSLAYMDCGHGSAALERAHAAASVARTALGEAGGALAGAWAFAAQALARAGAGDTALELVTQTECPESTGRAAWKRVVRQALIGIAGELAVHDPAGAARILDAERELLLRTRNRPHGLAGLLAGLAELLPAAERTDQSCRDGLDEAMRGALDYANEPPQTWQDETVLVHALLRIQAGEDPADQLDWFRRKARSMTCHPEHMPTAELAVVLALLGESGRAQRAADGPATPESRAVAFAAVAGHLARVPAHGVPFKGPTGPDPSLHTVRALALAACPHTPADPGGAAGFVRQALEGAGWHHALEVMARIAPEAVEQVWHITRVHLGHSDQGPASAAGQWT